MAPKNKEVKPAQQEDKKEFCIRCGSPDYLELTDLKNWEDKDGQKVYEYTNHCNKCGRNMPYFSHDGNMLSERIQVRKEILNPITPLSDKVNASSDTSGFQEPSQEFVNPLKDRSPKQIDLDAKQQERREAGLLD